MLYCPKCQRLQESDAQVCEICQETALKEPAMDDMVLLAEALSSPDTERLCNALSHAKIFFQCKDHSSIATETLADPLGCTILVRYESWQRACDLVNEIELDILDNTEPSQQNGEETENSRKKLISRIILFAFFIGIVWAVVALSDTVIAFVKGLFTGG